MLSLSLARNSDTKEKTWSALIRISPKGLQKGPKSEGAVYITTSLLKNKTKALSRVSCRAISKRLKYRKENSREDNEKKGNMMSIH